MYRDEKLDEEVVHILTRFEEKRERNKQLQLGPSELGQCREYIRNVMVGTPRQESEPIWPAAAAVGTLLGDYLERAVCDYDPDARREVLVTTELPSGVKVSGHADIVLPARNAVWDGKSKPRIHDVEKYGPSENYFIQISVYALGLVQAGVLQEGCTATLVYLARSGLDEHAVTYTIKWDEIQAYVSLAVQRLDEVLDAQEEFEATGDTAPLHALRDKTPQFCYHKRVMCPFRDACWKGSPNYPTDPKMKIEDPELAAHARAYLDSKEAEQAARSTKEQARDALVDINGITDDGIVITHTSRGAINVQRVK